MATHLNTDDLEVPWVSVTREQVSAVIGAYRVAVLAARALSVELVRSGVDPAVLRVTPTVAADGGPAVVITVRPHADRSGSDGSWSTAA